MVEVIPAEAGPFDNTAIASGVYEPVGTVTDQSQDGVDPDPDNDDDPTNNNVPTSVSFGPNLFDPPFGVKLLNSSGVPLLRWTMIWINNTNIVAVDAEAFDAIPLGTSFADNSISSGYLLPASVPAGSTNTGVTCEATALATITTHCYYEGPTGTYPRGRIVWRGTLGPDFGASNADEANNEISISFNVLVASGVTNVENIATINSDLNGDRDTNDIGEVRVASASAIWESGSELPGTGFAPGVVTQLPEKTADVYDTSNEILLEIPKLGIQIPVVGIPQSGSSWDVSWLGNEAGWLEGTAFPTMNGNSVLTSHVYNANGFPGPFVNLKSLRWGDIITVQAFGEKYTYMVQINRYQLPYQTSALAPSENPILTLITCNGYNEALDSYKYRVVVQAVLVSVE
ncbi:MAG: sortase [Thermoleophilia bacterium]|nr:sortase [Thermoleophilia bacterium]